MLIWFIKGERKCVRSSLLFPCDKSIIYKIYYKRDFLLGDSENFSEKYFLRIVSSFR